MTAFCPNRSSRIGAFPPSTCSTGIFAPSAGNADTRGDKQIFHAYECPVIKDQGRSRFGVRLSRVTSLMLSVFNSRISTRASLTPIPPCGGHP